MHVVVSGGRDGCKEVRIRAGVWRGERWRK